MVIKIGREINPLQTPKTKKKEVTVYVTSLIMRALRRTQTDPTALEVPDAITNTSNAFLFILIYKNFKGSEIPKKET